MTGPRPHSFDRVTGFPSSLSIVKSGAFPPTSTIANPAPATKGTGEITLSLPNWRPVGPDRATESILNGRRSFRPRTFGPPTDGSGGSSTLTRGGKTIAKYVLAADYTLMTDYRNVPLATFFSCIPTDYWQSRLAFRILANPPRSNGDGRPRRVPYGLRKIESSLVRTHGRESVVVADPRSVEEFIDDETEVVGLHSMDPLGLGPVSMSFTMGGVLTPYTKVKFLELAQRVQRPDRKYKVVLGGPGVWHFDYREGMQESLGIDHIEIGRASCRERV